MLFAAVWVCVVLGWLSALLLAESTLTTKKPQHTLQQTTRQHANAKHPTPTGRVTVNGVDATAANHRQAFVEQEDRFYSMLTARETLETAAALQLPDYIVSALWLV